MHCTEENFRARFTAAPWRIAALACGLAATPALATDFSFGLGSEEVTGVINTNLSIGAQWRTEDRAANLVGKTKVDPNLCPVARNGAGTSCQGHTDVAVGTHVLLNSYVGEGSAANQVAVDAPGQFSNNNDDGNLNYDQGDLTQAVGKLALDLTLNYGPVDLFVRGYGFYDVENHDRDDYSPNTQTPATTADLRRGIGEATSRRRNGVTEDQIGIGARLLDAYVATTLPLPFSDDAEITFKLGSQNINWGESTLLVVGSLNSFSTPNVNSLFRPAFLEISEVLEPTPAFLVSANVYPNVTVEAFYQYAWKPAEIPTAGSYLSTIDVGSDNQRDYIFLDFGKVAEDPDRLGLPDQLMLSAVTDTSGTIDLLPQNEASNDGQYGISLKYYAEWLNSGTEIGLYAGRYHSRLPYLSFYAGDYGCLSGPDALVPAEPGPGKPLADTLGTLGACPGLDSALVIEAALGAPNRDQNVAATGNAFVLDTVQARLEYPEGIELYGISFNTAFGETSFQGEIAYRPNQPLQVDDTDIAFAALQNIFPRGDGTGAVGDSYDFGLTPDLGTVAQLPGARYGVPDFVSAYRGKDPFGYEPGEYIRGWEYFDVTNFNLGLTNVIGPGNFVAADQIIVITEIGATQIYGLPEQDELQIEGPGTFTHASAGADGSGADGSQQANSAVIGPSGIRFNPTQQKDGFVTDFSWGYRLISILRYENVLPGIGVEPTIVWSHDVTGVSPGPGENFLEGRKTVITSAVIRFSSAWNAAVGYTMFFGGGNENLLRDRDFAQLGLRYQF